MHMCDPQRLYRYGGCGRFHRISFRQLPEVFHPLVNTLITFQLLLMNV